MRSKIWLAAAIAAGCAPTVDGPADHQRAIDRDDGDRLAAQLATLPGALRTSVTLQRRPRDPLALVPPPEATAVVVIVTDDAADRAATIAAATTLVHAVAPEIAHPAVVVAVGAPHVELASVGPFTVEARSRGPLRAVLAIAFALIAALAGWIALRERYRRANNSQ